MTENGGFTDKCVRFFDEYVGFFGLDSRLPPRLRSSSGRALRWTTRKGAGMAAVVEAS
ncbi:MAG: hypothetical protein LBQ52_02250 [Helicobacteraceae bacterium]|nr:hypothetical protein [Helicobacteraceae bacterium]